ncbi:MAG: histidine kinase, partial [bacterium]|nr:histidine kinase [bacterium]
MRRTIYSVIMKFLVLGALFLLTVNQCAYTQNTGFKYFNNYRPGIKDLQPQNWSVTQDKRGVIYVGNQGGLLEFDGVSWRSVRVPNWSVRSMAMDDAGTIYIGGKDEFGFFTLDSNGSLNYTSLSNRL